MTMTSLRRLLLGLCTGSVGLSSGATLQAATTYQATWASVDQHPASPEWFQDAKFGIYFHWGVFSVPAYHNEWYPRDMYGKGNSIYNHHVANYGDPFSSFPYDKFITGANDLKGNFTQFAPRLTSAGGKFDPAAWAQLFIDAGAKFAGPVAEHHDGFSMWNSSANEWNSVVKGPKLDLASQFSTAFRNRGLKFLMAMHHAYHFNGYYQYAPPQTNASLKKLYGQLGTTAENQLWYDKLKEIIDLYQPDIIWEDFDLNKVDETQRLKFLSYYYNKAIDLNKEVVATFKDGYDTKGEVYDFERGGPAAIQVPYWLTDDSISSSSWCYTTGMSYYSTVAMLHSLIDRVSKNGNMLLNIAPMADGTIPQAQQNVLLGIGAWLKPFGEAIYSTRIWTTFGEGPTAMGGGSFSRPRAGTAQDIRFTRNKSNTVLYATVLGWPGNGAQLNISSLSSSKISLAGLTNVQLLGANAGTYINLARQQDSNGLRVTMPASQPYSALAYALKLTFSGQIGGPAGSASVYQAEDALFSSGTVEESLHAGFTGSGYANTSNVVGSWVEWTVTVPTAGSYTLDFRFANGPAADRPTSLLVNGSGSQPTVNFPSTGAWETWDDVTVTATLKAGTNTIRLTATSANGCPNLDKLTVQ